MQFLRQDNFVQVIFVERFKHKVHIKEWNGTFYIILMIFKQEYDKLACFI